MSQNDDNLIAARNACVIHARALVESARAVLAAGHGNIAYHLAALALEEIGRHHLLAIQDLANRREGGPAWPGKHSQDHVRKLFWCFFGGQFLSEPISRDKLDGLQGLATQIHSKRLAALYVDNDEAGLSIPADAVSSEEAKVLVDLAETRIALAAEVALAEDRSGDIWELQRWLLDATDDPMKRRMILSKASLEKLAELGDAKSWVLWHKGQIEQSETESLALAQLEIERGLKGPTGEAKEKWRIRFRIETQSHAIRPKVLKKWNERQTWIQLTAAPEKRQLIVDLTLLDLVSIQGLWVFAWGLARGFVVALNIATRGFWWWQMPRDISHFYESIQDLQENCRVTLERSKVLRVNWGDNRALDEDDMRLLEETFAVLPALREHPMLDHYTAGLTFLSKNDIHWQCEPIAFGGFLQSLRAMMQHIGQLGEEGIFLAALEKFLAEAFTQPQDCGRIVALATAFERKEETPTDLRDVAMMKVLCDLYFLKLVLPSELGRRRNELAAVET